VVYGDSVTGPTPTTVRFDGRVYIETFERLADRWGGGRWLPCLEDGREDKESCELPGLEVWTEAGWTPAHRVIRHRLAPEKRVMRVLTHTGMVDVTDDHSLLDSHGQDVSAQNVDVGFELLHAKYPTLAEGDKTITPNEARVMGMFCGDGSGEAKVGPDAILNAPVEVRQAFWDELGLHNAGGGKDAKRVVHIDQENQVSIASFALLASSLG
jgi:hypothetical protein